MEYTDVMRELKQLGTAQNIKIYKRHGAGENLFGVSFADLNKLQKRIKVDHELAEKLWKSGNTDARTLATMIADPSVMTEKAAAQWVLDIDYYVLMDLFASLIAKTPFADSIMRKWMKSKEEYVCQGGYSLLASRLKEGHDISDDDCRAILTTIKDEIHQSPDRARHAMNGALIAVGIYKRSLTDDAIAAAKAIGKVAVDHGETSCVTPDAVEYIKKAISRRPKKK
jgi:3-methyladenine DNA glycosylase AlkD